MWFVGVIVYVCIMQAATWFHCACCRVPTQNDKQHTLKLNLLRDAGKSENHWETSPLPGPLLRKCAVKHVVDALATSWPKTASAKCWFCPLRPPQSPSKHGMSNKAPVFTGSYN